jgi:hypothetical protein
MRQFNAYTSDLLRRLQMLESYVLPLVIYLPNAYIPYAVIEDMPADGLTKELPKQKHAVFVEQLHLADIEQNRGQVGIRQ